MVDNAGLTAALVTLARVFAPLVAAELREPAGAEPADDWIDQTCSPLGRRLHCALARCGKLPARKMGRRWLVRRADVDAYIVEHGRAVAPPPSNEDGGNEADEADVRSLLAMCGMVAAAPAANGAPAKTSGR